MVPIVADSYSTAKPSLWIRIRVQLGGGLLLAVAVPWLIRLQFDQPEGFGSLQQSAVGTALAVLLGYYGFRRLTRYPGVRAGYHILPVFVFSFTAVLSVFFFARLDYSRLHFLASFTICILWYFAVYFVAQRHRRLRIAVVPCGEVDQLFSVSGVDWVKLTKVSEPADCDAIVADLRSDMPPDWERFLADCAVEGRLVMHVKQVAESLTGRVAIEHLSENNFGSLVPGLGYGRAKRLIDVVGTLLLLPLLLPLMLICALLIRLDSPGSVLFRQQRMGHRGRPFTMYKFRTMLPAPDTGDDPRLAAITRDGDDRITAVGQVLRRYRLDELPQVFNILRGEMSWIGPRPEAVPLSLWYEGELPFYRYRHIVRPGLTGWAQVKQGHVAEVSDVLSKLHYDFYYIKNFSFWLDVLIVASTLRIVASGFGAK